MKPHKNRVIICLEGIVGAGKTTQIEMLNKHFSPNSYLISELNNISPMKEVREEIRKSQRASNLTYEDVINIAQARGEIQQRLLKETDKPIILMDRGIYTGMVFESGELSMLEVEDISKKFGVITPDICFVLYCSAEKSLNRIDERRVRVGRYLHRAFHENKEYINKTKKRYFEIAKIRPIILINASETIDEVREKILRGIYDTKIL